MKQIYKSPNENTINPELIAKIKSYNLEPNREKQAILISQWSKTAAIKYCRMCKKGIFNRPSIENRGSHNKK